MSSTEYPRLPPCTRQCSTVAANRLHNPSAIATAIKLKNQIATSTATMAEPARHGREKQRYDGDTRLVAGCLPVLPDGRVLLIGSVKSTDWLLPKGGWEHDETSAEAAVREAYEEAGVSVRVGVYCSTMHVPASVIIDEVKFEVGGIEDCNVLP